MEKGTCGWLHVSSPSNVGREELEQESQAHLQSRDMKLHSPSKYRSDQQPEACQHLAPEPHVPLSISRAINHCLL